MRWSRAFNQVSGLHPGKSPKKVAAALGYAVAALLVLAGVVGSSAAVAILGLEALAGTLLLANAWGVRSLLPLLGSRSRRSTAIGWMVFVISASILFVNSLPKAEMTAISKGPLAPSATDIASPAGARLSAPVAKSSSAEIPAKPTPGPPAVALMMPSGTSVPFPEAAVARAKPGNVEELPGYLEAFLPPEAAGQIALMPYPDGNGVSAVFTIAVNWSFNQRTYARRYARDFVFAAYSTGLPVKMVEIVIMRPSGELGLGITLGANVAASQPASTWTDSTVEPTIFIDWMKDAAKEASNGSEADRAAIDGPWAN